MMDFVFRSSPMWAQRVPDYIEAIQKARPGDFDSSPVWPMKQGKTFLAGWLH